jgi:photosystem II stability/assembly factor-like uncharacterized protein
MNEILTYILIALSILVLGNCKSSTTASDPVILFSDNAESDKLKGQIVSREEDFWKTDIRDEGIGQYLGDVQVLDDGTIFGVGDNNRIYRIAKSAKKWQERSIALPKRSFISSLHFADESTGLISVIQTPEDVLDIEGFYSWIYSTMDGGHTWKEEFSGQGIEILKVIIDSEKSRWAVGRRIVKTDQIESYPLFLGKNAGNAWSAIDVPKETGSIRDIYIDGNLNKILVKNDGELLKFDVFSNWTIKEGIKSLRSPQIAITTVGVSKDNTLYLMGATGGRSHGMWTSLFSKKQHSKQWNHIILSDVILRDALFLTAGEILACGSMYSTGTEVDSGFSENGSSTAVILLSLDAGRTWSVTYQTQEFGSFNGIFLTEEDRFLAVGRNGQVLRLIRKD